MFPYTQPDSRSLSSLEQQQKDMQQQQQQLSALAAYQQNSYQQRLQLLQIQRLQQQRQQPPQSPLFLSGSGTSSTSVLLDQILTGEGSSVYPLLTLSSGPAAVNRFVTTVGTNVPSDPTEFHMIRTMLLANEEKQRLALKRKLLLQEQQYQLEWQQRQYLQQQQELQQQQQQQQQQQKESRFLESMLTPAAVRNLHVAQLQTYPQMQQQVLHEPSSLCAIRKMPSPATHHDVDDVVKVRASEAPEAPLPTAALSKHEEEDSGDDDNDNLEPEDESPGDSNGLNSDAPATSEATGQSPANKKPKKKDTKWLATLQELRRYKEDNGDCIVPRGYAANPRLASWVAEQRKQYKLLKDGKQSSITPERVALLNELDFAWNAQEAAWTRHMSDLKRFSKETGHCHVPLNHPVYPKLGLWVKEQRRHYTLLKQGRQSHMTVERAAELDQIGFCWDTHEATWLERLGDLTEYKAANGHCLVPTNYGKLGTWVHHQRRQYKKFKEGKPCHITLERIAALEELGFVWYPREKAAVVTSCRSVEGAASSSSSTLSLCEDEDEESLSGDEDADVRPRKRQRPSC